MGSTVGEVVKALGISSVLVALSLIVLRMVRKEETKLKVFGYSTAALLWVASAAILAMSIFTPPDLMGQRGPNGKEGPGMQGGPMTGGNGMPGGPMIDRGEKGGMGAPNRPDTGEERPVPSSK
jgi:hypothetical protein